MGLLLTVTLTADEVRWFPDASRARAVNECWPSLTDDDAQLVEYGDDVSSVPSGLPSRRNCTPTTRTLSDALAVTVTAPDTIDPFVGAVTDTFGCVVSLLTVT